MTDRYGPRGVIAFLVPQQNANMQPEYEGLRPPGVSNQIYRFELESQEAVEEAVLRALPACHGCWPDLIVGGNSLEMRSWSLERQIRYREELREGAGDVPVINATDATEAALRSVGAQRIGMMVPLFESTAQSASAYYKALGFDVPYLTWLGIGHPKDSINVPIETIEAAFEEIDHDDVDTLLHVGGSLGVADMVERLEAKFNKPVISGIPATYWFALRTLGIDDPIPGFGQLLLKPEIGA
ncbi:MAG: hypothetical protein OER92_11850 [Alphaproteobacteria bacterium]|nr:hypothetical protein [Alphaproteobacteria bacterium]